MTPRTGVGGDARLLTAMFCAGFATFAQMFASQALLADIAREVGTDAAGASLTLSAITLGVAISILPWTFAADRAGTRRMIAIAIVASSLIGLAVPLIGSYSWFLIARLINGLALGAVPALAMVFVTQQVSARRVAAAAGTFVAGNTIGGVAGRLVAGLFEPFVGWRGALIVVAALCLISAVLFSALAPRDHSAPKGGRVRDFAIRVGVQLRDPVMLGLFVFGLLAMGTFTAMYSFVSHRLEQPDVGVIPEMVTWIFLVYFVGTLAARFSANLNARFGAAGAIAIGLSAMLGGALLTLVGNAWVIVGGLAVFTAGFFVTHPIAGSKAPQLAVYGAGQAGGMYQLSTSLGGALLGWSAGAVYELWGWTGAALTFGAQIALAGVVIAAGVALGRRYRPSATSESAAAMTQQLGPGVASPHDGH